MQATICVENLYKPDGLAAEKLVANFKHNYTFSYWESFPTDDFYHKETVNCQFYQEAAASKSAAAASGVAAVAAVAACGRFCPCTYDGDGQHRSSTKPPSYHHHQAYPSALMGHGYHPQSGTIDAPPYTPKETESPLFTRDDVALVTGEAAPSFGASGKVAHYSTTWESGPLSAQSYGTPPNDYYQLPYYAPQVSGMIQDHAAMINNSNNNNNNNNEGESYFTLAPKPAFPYHALGSQALEMSNQPPLNQFSPTSHSSHPQPMSPPLTPLETHHGVSSHHHHASSSSIASSREGIASMMGLHGSHGSCSTKNACPVCGKTYARPSTLKTHMRIHSGERPYDCYICRKSFSQAANLTAHLRIHSGERPFSCTVCGKTFSQSSSVTTHMRTHSGERPYRCRVCNKGFSDSSTLTKHARIHSGEKPYRCPFCSMSFSQSGNLNRHVKVHQQRVGDM